MLTNKGIWIAHDGAPIYLNLSMANRHGLIAGATGTGKTITLKVLAESFSAAGVPVFMADVKGDLSGMITPGTDSENMQKRITKFGIENWKYTDFPTHFWDIFGERGTPIRCTVSDMGPTLLARLLNLTEVQEGVLSIVFRIADDQGLSIIDLKDLRSMLQFVGDHRNEYTLQYGNVSSQSIGAIQRGLLQLEDAGGNVFFGEPALDIKDWIRTDFTGRGYINVLNSDNLIQNPLLYSTFLLWMLSELFEMLPEVGDLDKPRLVFFFDEAHLLFKDTPKALLTKITQVVKLIRSKGVGVYFVTQSPSDIPDEVLAQLSNRVQHALRAFTPAEQKAVRTAAQTFRQNPEFKVEDVITELGVGEALVSFLDEGGIPGIVQRAKILPPQSLMGPASDSDIEKAINASEFELKYRDSFDSISAYEVLTQKSEEEEQARLEEEAELQRQKDEESALKAQAKVAKSTTKKTSSTKSSGTVAKTAQRAVNSATSSITRSVSSNVVKTLTGGKKASTGKIIERAATAGLNSLLSSGAKAITRGLFGTKK